MKKPLLVLAALALVATPALAERADRWIGLRLGGSLPSGDFKQWAAAGFEGGVVGTLMQSDHVGVGADVVYHSWGGTEHPIVSFVPVLGQSMQVKYRAIQTTAHVVYDFQTREGPKPYLQGGCGLYFIKSTLATSMGPFEETKPQFGFDVGAGFRLGHGARYDIGIGGTFHSIQGAYPANFVTIGANLMWGIGGR